MSSVRIITLRMLTPAYLAHAVLLIQCAMSNILSNPLWFCVCLHKRPFHSIICLVHIQNAIHWFVCLLPCWLPSQMCTLTALHRLVVLDSLVSPRSRCGGFSARSSLGQYFSCMRWIDVIFVFLYAFCCCFLFRWHLRALFVWIPTRFPSVRHLPIRR